jgi:uncharacterized DUF497 family protein
MADLAFTWSPTKARGNEKKHGISFIEAQTVFLDDHARLLNDPGHSLDEERFVLLGVSARLRVLVVVHAYQESAGLIRIISARRATPGERAHYEQGERR